MSARAPADVRIASHRGGAALWPENSEAAFRGTARLAVEQVEFDVQMSADGHVVVFHDATLERMTDGRGPLGERTLAELRELGLAGGGRLLTLDDALELLADTHLTLRCELKPDHRLMPYPGIVDATVERFEAYAVLERAVFTSFHLPTVAELVERDLPAEGVIWLVAEQATRLLGTRAIATLARDAGVGSVAIHEALLDRAAFERLERAGLEVGAFAVLEDDAIERALRMGVAVFTTDRPDAALAIRARLARDSCAAGHRPRDGTR